MSADFANSNLAAIFAIDTGKAENGAWFDVTDEIKVKVRRYKSKASQDARTEFMKPYAQMARRGQELPEHIATEVLNNQIAKGVLVDWKGVKAGDAEIPATFENKVAILASLPEFRDAVFAYSVEMDAFKPSVEEGLKN